MDNIAEEKQCRICLDGPDLELGRLIRPCLCKGSISYVHTQCLQRWRKESAKSFYSCPQCGYKYMTARTSVLGLASNSMVLASFSTILFICLVYCASFLATFFLSGVELDDTPNTGFGYFGYTWISPLDVASNLLKTVFRILYDEDVVADNLILKSPLKTRPKAIYHPPGALESFLRRVFIGLPVVGVVSLVQLLWSASMLMPINALARLRGRDRRENGRNIATIIILLAVIIGIMRALLGVYRLTEKAARYVLIRAEDIILEV